ncbi:unnamed protein product [Linum trigynum]|uniref:Uncharacterized protein n=1 Tax=Linum trigynum TaxID=586398 RepID=A0AAV2EVY0_9ROSI
MMVVAAQRLLAFIICIWLFTIQPRHVAHGREIIFMGSGKQVQLQQYHARVLGDVVTHQGMNTKKKGSEGFEKGYDANRSSKRRVRRGSDPIHNKT